MSLGSSFSEFISGISPTPTQRENAISGHRTLRERLQADPDLSSRIVAVFIQGSYRRATAVRPVNGTRSDVDLVVDVLEHGQNISQGLTGGKLNQIVRGPHALPPSSASRKASAHMAMMCPAPKVAL